MTREENDDDVSSLARDEYDSDDEEEHSHRKKPLKLHPRVRAFNLSRAAELALNVASAIIALQHLEDFQCCDESDGDWLLTNTGHTTLTLLYLGWMGIEWFVLVFSMRNYHRERRNQDENHVVHVMNSQDHTLNWLVCFNPYLGGLQAWYLLYNKQTVLSLWVIEGVACIFLILSFWWQPNHHPCLWVLQCLVPIIPWASACVALWYVFDKGGVCYTEGNFWHEGCELPGDTSPGTSCGQEEQFCFYKY